MQSNPSSSLSRRRALALLGGAAASPLFIELAIAAPDSFSFAMAHDDELFLDDFERRACMFFWEQASPQTGQVLDRARNDLSKGARDPRKMASIASTGFGLTALCIADHRGYLPHDKIVERVQGNARLARQQFHHEHGFYYHFTDIETGVPFPGTEVSSIDTALLLCGVLTARAYFKDPKIHEQATKIYERVDWPWMLNGGKTFSMGWFPDKGFLDARWEHFCELMMIYLLAIGSPTTRSRRAHGMLGPDRPFNMLASSTSAATTPSLPTSIRTPGLISEASTTSTRTILRTQSRRPTPTKRFAFRCPNGTQKTIGVLALRIIRAATLRGGAPCTRANRWNGRAQCGGRFVGFCSRRLFACIAAMKAKYGQRAGGTMALWMPFIQRRTGTIRTFWASIRAYRSSWLRICAAA